MADESSIHMRIFDSDRLFRIAYVAVQRSLATPDDAIVAILFSATGLEAFVNELGEWAAIEVNAGPELRQLAWTLRILEQAHGSTKEKVRWGVEALTGEIVKFDRPPLQDLPLLLQIRDGLVHGRHEEVKWLSDSADFGGERQKKLARKLESRKIIPKISRTSLPVPWMEAVSRPTAAQWAFNTALESARFLTRCLPESFAKRQLLDTLATFPTNRGSG